MRPGAWLQSGMMTEVAIRVENLSKQYRIGKREVYRTMRDTLTADSETARHPSPLLHLGERAVRGFSAQRPYAPEGMNEQNCP